MSINVICPGCLKRFQVGDRFAGMQGPCPNCKTPINIPKASVEIHKTASEEPLLRLNIDFDLLHTFWFGLATLGVFLLACCIGWLSVSDGIRTAIGTLGLLFVAFPLSLFGYQVMRDRETLFVLTGYDLYSKIGISAAVYAVLWILLECLIRYMQADEMFIGIYFVMFAYLAICLTHAVLDINFGSAFLHYAVFCVPVIFLRYLIGLRWIWLAYEPIHRGAAPPPPFLPGM